jgi:hypothetical protein
MPLDRDGSEFRAPRLQSLACAFDSISCYFLSGVVVWVGGIEMVRILWASVGPDIVAQGLVL